MGSYYYLAAQLPYLSYGQKPPMSSAAFRDLAKQHLSSGDLKFFELVDMDPGDKKPLDKDQKHGAGSELSYVESAPLLGCDFIDRWREWERALRLNLAKQRAQKMAKEGTETVPPPMFPTDAAAVAMKAVTATESPLEAELVLDKARWAVIDSLEGLDYFNRNTIYAYLLKLILLERHEVFNVEKGFNEYKSLYASILGSVQPGSSPAGEIK